MRTAHIKHFDSVIFKEMESLRSLEILFVSLKLDLASAMRRLISFSYFASVVSQDPK